MHRIRDVVEGPSGEPVTSYDSAKDCNIAGHDEQPSTSSSTGTADKRTTWSSDLIDCTEPYQPHLQFLETQTLVHKSLTFQQKWFQDFSWLHYSPSVKGVLCFHCNKGYSNRSSFGQRADASFLCAGFRNWKKVTEKFTTHKNSQAHHHNINVSAHQMNPISTQLSCTWGKQQEEARHCFRKIVSSVRLVARQGQALRGHLTESDNLHQLLKLRAEEDDPKLQKWLTERNTMYTSSKSQY